MSPRKRKSYFAKFVETDLQENIMVYILAMAAEGSLNVASEEILCTNAKNMEIVP